MKTLKDISRDSFLNEAQLLEIEEIILSHGNYHADAVRECIEWFCIGTGMPDYYFQTTPIKTIASHIEAIKAAEIIASFQEDHIVEIDIHTELENEAIYLVDDRHERAREIERRIEGKYSGCRLKSYRAAGRTRGVENLRMYLVEMPDFATGETNPEETDLEQIASRSFLETTTKSIYRRYQNVINQTVGWESPLIKISHKKETGELRMYVISNSDSGSRFFSNISDVLNSHNLVSNRKYIEPFANGKTVYGVYLDDITDQELLQDICEDISLVYVIPESPLSPLFRDGKLSAQETVFGVAAWTFAYQFLTEYDEEYVALVEALKDDPEMVGLLRTLRRKLAKGSYDEARVWDALVNNHEHLKKAFRCFEKKFDPFEEDHQIEERITVLREEIITDLSVEIDRKIFEAILLFIGVTQRTNFFKKEKTSLSFMLDPAFLNKVDYPEAPFRVFLIIGSEFRGFHIRFRDIARGGIRIVRSGNLQSFLKNSDSIFDENYDLALTQQRKNKDIPEGGAKGTILLRWSSQDKAEAAFKKYIDGLLDLMLVGREVVDHYGHDVFLFLGPDEGTAEMMEWASTRARMRKYPYWKAFSTGKPLSMGGIPHDLYGMTTNSIHEYVLNMLEKNGLKESQVTKVMTGGPDGDLGSNEILISKDIIVAIVDGSGVAFDPSGLNRRELRKLAKKRVMIENFDRTLISEKGFLVTTQEKNSVLPGGEKIKSGLEFRNTFHLRPEFSADLFVPCGGRPASININNWTQVLDERGRPRFRFIVEGANLFITQEARLRLEEKGVIIYKDASTNKGGVTSSSLEVLSSLVLSDKEHQDLMCVKGREIPQFRKRFIAEVIDLIKQNARLEFEIIWKENREKGIPRPVLTDLISRKINGITDAIYGTDLYREKKLFREVIHCCCPPVLLEAVDIDTIIKRIPNSYLRAIFASRLASRYVYSHGLDANELDFYYFVSVFKNGE